MTHQFLSEFGGGQTPWAQNIQGAGFDLEDAGSLGHRLQDEEIAAGVIGNITSGYLRLETEGLAATDNWDGFDNIIARSTVCVTDVSSARDVTAVDGSGDLRLAGNFTLASQVAVLTLVAFNDSLLLEIGRSTN